MKTKLKSSDKPIYIEASRSERREALHTANAVCCNADGEVLGYFGNPEYETYFRSAAKPFQLLTALKLRPELLDECSDTELAVMSSSHSGERGHIDTILGLLARYGLGEEHLQCGTHTPYYARANWEYGRDEREITIIHCNCSGKHTAMLLAIQAQGWSMDNYLDADHPMQIANTARIAKYVGREPETVEYGVDGCSVPSWWLPIRECAQCYARYTSPDWIEDDFEERAIDRTFDAFHSAAWHTAGTTRFGTPLNAESDGKWLGKIGGEGIFCVGFRNRGIGVLVKVIDGNSRAVPPALLYAMKEWDLIDEDQLERLKDRVQVERRNAPGVLIGYMRVVE